MCILQVRRWCAAFLLPLGLAACGYDGAELIPPGLRATLAAEDRAGKPAGTPEKAISVDEMLSRARTGSKSATPPAEETAATPKPLDGAAAPAADAVPAASETHSNVQVASVSAPATPSGVHPLWAQMVAERKPGMAPVSQGASGGNTAQLAAVATPSSKPTAPAPAPDARTLVLRFPGAETDLGAEERRRLDAAVALYKTNSNAARIVAGPSGERPAFEQVLFAERRARAVESALPSEIKPSRSFSPDIDTNTVRVEFRTSQP